MSRRAVTVIIEAEDSFSIPRRKKRINPVIRHMGIDKTKKAGFKILLGTILCVFVLFSASRADDQDFTKNLPQNNLSDLIGNESHDFSLREIFSASRNEAGEAYYFFIPKTMDDKNQYTYVYDTKFDRLLLFPKSNELITKIENQEINPENWPEFLNEMILNGKTEVRGANDKVSPRLRVIDLDKEWVKFTLGGRHIVLPRKLMVEGWGQKNFPLGEEIVNKDVSLPEDYFPDDLVKIHQKWNFHAPDYSKYLRRYVAGKIGQMLQNAAEQGIHIRVFSAYRSYEKQRYLYLNAISRSGESQNGVAAPGHSEHQLGTAVDLCGLDPETVLSPNFDRTKEGRWLKENAGKFGFYQSYTRENQGRTGYIPEPWHYRFLREVR